MGFRPRSGKPSEVKPKLIRPVTVVPQALQGDERAQVGRGRVFRRNIAVLLTVVAIVGGTVYGFEQYRVIRVARLVRRLFATREYERAQVPLSRWLAKQPRSGEAYYYKAWQALALNQPQQAVQAVDNARKLGFDPGLIDCLTAIYDSRADRFGQAEPVLEQAFVAQTEPQEMVAKELARIYLSTYRLDRAALAIERWRGLAPEDPQPCLWSNEIASRSNAETAILIQNYRAALDRDPNLDKARLGLAQQLSKDRRFDEAEQEFRAFLQRNPNNTAALLGLGRNAFQQGDIEQANQFFTSALETNPRDTEALKELGQLDLRLGRLQKACEHLKLLSQLAPFDHEVRYSYAQALKLAGDESQSRIELAQAAQLRKEHDQVVQLRYGVLKNPRDLNTRFQVAKWMIEHGHEDEGLKWTKEILRADPRHAPTHRVLADYYEKHGEPGLANFHHLVAQAGKDEG
jgi:tetratricopeptide (TPR) repeat protein